MPWVSSIFTQRSLTSSSRRSSPVSSSSILPRPPPGQWTHLKAHPNTSAMSTSPTLSLPAAPSCAAPPLTRFRFSGENCCHSALAAPRQDQKSQEIAFPPATSPRVESLSISFSDGAVSVYFCYPFSGWPFRVPLLKPRNNLNISSLNLNLMTLGGWAVHPASPQRLHLSVNRFSECFHLAKCPGRRSGVPAKVTGTPPKVKEE